MFKTRDFHWALFVGHLCIEKLLKAYFIKNVNSNFPYTHNLVLLAERANLELNQEQKEFLVDVTSFNISARYEDYKKKFREKCTEKFTKSNLI
jgi:HEPN domain-containing protein